MKLSHLLLAGTAFSLPFDLLARDAAQVYEPEAIGEGTD